MKIYDMITIVTSFKFIKSKIYIKMKMMIRLHMIAFIIGTMSGFVEPKILKLPLERKVSLLEHNGTHRGPSHLSQKFSKLKQIFNKSEDLADQNQNTTIQDIFLGQNEPLESSSTSQLVNIVDTGNVDIADDDTFGDGGTIK